MRKIRHDSTDFDNSSEGKIANKQFKKVLIDGILCVAAGLLYLVYNIFGDSNWYDYLICIALLTFGAYFIYKSYDLKITAVNVYKYNHKK